MTIEEKTKIVFTQRMNPHEALWKRLKERSESILDSVLSGGNTPIELNSIIGKNAVETPADWLAILDYVIRCRASSRDKTRISAAMSTWVQAFYEFEAVKPNG